MMKPWAANPPSPIDPGGDPSPLRTSWRSSTSTTGAAVTATRVPSCDEKACTRATWSSGDGPGTRGHSPDWRPRSAPAADHPLRWSWHGPGDEPIEPRPSWPRRGWSSRSREKHRSSWSGCWPRATRTPSSSGDRGHLQGRRRGVRHHDGLSCGRSLPSHPLPLEEGPGARTASASTNTTERLEPGRARSRARGPAGALRRRRPGPGLGHPLGRGNLLGLGVHHVPPVAPLGRGSRAPAPGPPIHRARSPSSWPSVPTRSGPTT
jgi:hypothetical protein